MPQLPDLVLKGRSLAAFKDRGEFADLFCNTRYSCLAERDNVFRKVKWRRPVVQGNRLKLAGIPKFIFR